MKAKSFLQIAVLSVFVSVASAGLSGRALATDFEFGYGHAIKRFRQEGALGGAEAPAYSNTTLSGRLKLALERNPGWYLELSYRTHDLKVNTNLQLPDTLATKTFSEGSALVGYGPLQFGFSRAQMPLFYFTDYSDIAWTTLQTYSASIGTYFEGTLKKHSSYYTGGGNYNGDWIIFNRFRFDWVLLGSTGSDLSSSQISGFTVNLQVGLKQRLTTSRSQGGISLGIDISGFYRQTDLNAKTSALQGHERQEILEAAPRLFLEFRF